MLVTCGTRAHEHVIGYIRDQVTRIKLEHVIAVSYTDPFTPTPTATCSPIPAPTPIHTSKPIPNLRRYNGAPSYVLKR